MYFGPNQPTKEAPGQGPFPQGRYCSRRYRQATGPANEEGPDHSRKAVLRKQHGSCRYTTSFPFPDPVTKGLEVFQRQKRQGKTVAANNKDVGAA